MSAPEFRPDFADQALSEVFTKRYGLNLPSSLVRHAIFLLDIDHENRIARNEYSDETNRMYNLSLKLSQDVKNEKKGRANIKITQQEGADIKGLLLQDYLRKSSYFQDKSPEDDKRSKILDQAFEKAIGGGQVKNLNQGIHNNNGIISKVKRVLNIR